MLDVDDLWPRPLGDPICESYVIEMWMPLGPTPLCHRVSERGGHCCSNCERSCLRLQKVIFERQHWVPSRRISLIGGAERPSWPVSCIGEDAAVPVRIHRRHPGIDTRININSGVMSSDIPSKLPGPRTVNVISVELPGPSRSRLSQPPGNGPQPAPGPHVQFAPTIRQAVSRCHMD